ncbi:modD protein [Rhodopseudomonas palustris HaA2]|uniref:Putative pyrophosphorylase ModD n=1 Tax=Rhodopseudomonas palustris (strain HaA2) TaxID=316058 RepID=Q2J194_RHOP2|nr:ModD protein [Rhodopseudomonas palustris]ABD05766.1 modD protein [Rhodopseudomonas palustris HaA2]
MPAAATTELERLLDDDVPHGDLTTELLGIGGEAGVMAFTARDPMVLALAEDAAAILRLCGCEVELLAATGTKLAPGAPILIARGAASGLLRGWKVAQTLIEIWSGVATATREIVEAARAVSPGIAIACTRKNTPGTKRFAVAAVKAGGAGMHRLGLSETILVFAEHRGFLDEPAAATVARLRAAAPEKKLVTEVSTIDAALAAAAAGYDVLQLEKFAPADVATLVARLAETPLRPVIAAAGGVNASNAAAYAAAGAQVLVTSAPYMAKPRDVQVRIRRATTK